MNTTTVEGFRFALDISVPGEPRRYKVRPVAEADRGALHELLRHAPGIDRTKPPTETPQTAPTCLGVFDDMRVLRAMVELRPGTPDKDAWFLELMVVDPRYRRAGLGAALVEEIVQRLKAQGIRRLVLEVDEPNAAAMRFWQRHGLVECGRREGRRVYERIF